MSQEAEYFLRNISRNEVRQLAARISRQDRAESERRLQGWWQQQSRVLEGRMRGELDGLHRQMKHREQHLQQHIDCNRRLAEALQRQSDLHGEVLLEQQKALGVLADHNRELDAAIQETRSIQQRLADRLRETESRLEGEITERRQERERQGLTLQVQQRLASEAIGRLDNQHLQFLGLEPEMRGLRNSLDRAMRISATPSEEQAAVALLAEAQNQTDRLTLEVSRREMELGRFWETTRLNLERGCQRLDEFRGDSDALQVFASTIAAITQQLEQAQNDFARLRCTPVTDFSSALARWERQAASASSITEQIEQLWRERDQVLDKIRSRNRILEAVIEALIEVWGAQFEIDYLYAVTDDPRSTLMLQTKRTFGRNVTVHVDLDGRMQISFTGYLGMECAKDVADFRQQLEKAGDLKVEQVALHDQPDKPNPPGVDGGGGGALIYREPIKRKNECTSKDIGR